MKMKIERKGERLGRLVYSVTEAAKLLGISRASAFQAVEHGEVTHVRIGRRILVPKAALDKMLAEATVHNTETGR
jgi:excisionase family DNA binding protein